MALPRDIDESKEESTSTNSMDNENLVDDQKVFDISKEHSMSFLASMVRHPHPSTMPVSLRDSAGQPAYKHQILRDDTVPGFPPDLSAKEDKVTSSHNSDSDVTPKSLRHKVQPKTVTGIISCSVCAKVFKQKSDLLKHCFTCEGSVGGFPTKPEQNDHVSPEHPPTSGLYVCHCGYQSKVKSHLKRHYNYFHGQKAFNEMTPITMAAGRQLSDLGVERLAPARRRLILDERARAKAVRRAGACLECKTKKQKVRIASSSFCLRVQSMLTVKSSVRTEQALHIKKRPVHMAKPSARRLIHPILHRLSQLRSRRPVTLLKDTRI